MNHHHVGDLRSLTGYVSALPTPFRNGGDSIDEEAFSAFCDWQITQGISALVVCGTTGEAPTLSAEEQRRLVRLAVEASAGRVPVIAGAGSNATAHAAALACAAEAAGADGVLAVVPYYNKPSQEGLYRHFRTLAEAVGISVILYDVPARTGCALANDTVARLAELPGIVGLKDATGDLARLVHLRRLLGSGFRLFTGEDATVPGYFAQSGDGCISVTSNVAPGLCVRLLDACEAGDHAEALSISIVLANLTRALFTESNPVPVKYALDLMGLMSARVRLPLWAAAEETRREVREALRYVGILPAGESGGQPTETGARQVHRHGNWKGRRPAVGSAMVST